MPLIKRSALASYSAEQMFALVNDVESYPQFVSMCKRVEVLERKADEMTARLELNAAGVTHHLTTVNRFTPGKSIEMRLADGPLQALSGRWQFTALDAQACRIDLELDFSWQTKLQRAFGERLLRPLANSLVDAFCKRAESLSGQRQSGMKDVNT